MSGDLLSICVPAYQAARYVDECVRSALEGGYEPVEVVVVDDASTDATADLVAPLLDDTVRLVRNDRNLGRMGNIQRSLELARGDLLLVLPADCRVVAGSIAERVQALEALEHPAYAFGAATLIDEDGKLLDVHAPFRSKRVLTAGQALRALLPWDPVYTSTCVFTRRAYDAVGGFRVDLAPSHRDWDLFVRMSLEGSVAYLPTPQADERVHGANATAALEHRELIALSELLVLDGITEWVSSRRPDLSPVVSEAREQWARTQLAHAVLGKLGLDERSPTKSLGLALLGSSTVRRTPRYLAASAFVSLPDAITRGVVGAALRRWRAR